MKRILFVFNHPAPYKVRLFNELSNDFEVHVIFERDCNKDRSKKFYFENNYKFINHQIKGIKLGNENIVSRGIINHLKSNNYDLVIMNGYSTFAEMSAIRWMNKNKIPFVLYINGGIIKHSESKWKKNLKTKYISSASYFLSPDNESNKYLCYYGANKTKIFNYPYSSINNQEILKNKISEKEKKILKEKLNITYKNVFVSSGQFIKRKNYFALIELWKNQPKDYELILLGDGPEFSRMHKYIKENNIQNIKLPGFKSRQEMFEYFKISDAFIFPSNEDIYGHVIVEAMSQGLPVISSSNVNASKLIIRNGENGYILDSFSNKALSESIKNILKKNMFDNCVNSVKQYTIEETRKSNAKAFKEIISK